MVSQVFYRKWRPQSLSEIVGQESVTQTLRRAVDSGKIAHAYLFCGPRGTGKTSTARILAKAVNCPNQKGGEPCNACDMCSAITEGRAMDVIEIDAASNRGIDEVRSLREKANYAPNLARYKVYIIDEVHMLTEAACNALLKILEEPPPHVIFILATTEAHKVLATIVSRCQRFNFRRLEQAEIVNKLSLICEREGIQVGTDSLGLIARAATGSLRDAENILQQLITYYGDQIGFGQVQAALGFSWDSRIKELARSILNRDVATGLRIISSINRDGVDLRQFNLGLVEYLRGLLLTKSQCSEALSFTREDLVEMESLVSNATLAYLLKVVKCFSGIDFRNDSYSTLPLELALLDCALSSLEDEREVSRTESLGANEAARASQSSVESGILVAPSNNIEKMAPNKEVLADIGYFRSHWKEFIESLRGEGSTGNLDAFLRSACDPIGVEDDTLVLGFYYSFHKEKIEDPKYKYLMERKLKEVFGRAYKVRCVLVDRKKRREAKKEDPLIKAALEMGARISEKD